MFDAWGVPILLGRTTVKARAMPAKLKHLFSRLVVGVGPLPNTRAGGVLVIMKVGAVIGTLCLQPCAS